jgi:hypothetical protein
MESPAGFVTGLGKGTGSLFSGLAVGAITSTAAIVAGYVRLCLSVGLYECLNFCRLLFVHVTAVCMCKYIMYDYVHK